MAKTLYLGIDVSMAENTCCPLLQDGTEARRRFTVPNNLPGAEQLVKEIVTLVERYRVDRLVVGLEATNLYWWHLACFLNSRLPPEKGELLPKDPPYSVANVQPSKLDISPQDFLGVLKND